MSVILVLEQDAGYAGRISSVLRAAGHEVHVVQSMDHALQIATARPPQLFLASGANAGAADLLDRFARRRGGPGSVVLLPSTLAEQVQAADYRADEILTKPFTESDLHALAHRFLSAAPAPQPAAPKSQLTSADIFGDVLAEVEAEAQKSAAARRASRDDVNKKLEETLAGVFPMADRPRPAAPPPAAGAPAAAPRPPVPSGMPPAPTLASLGLSPTAPPAANRPPAGVPPAGIPLVGEPPRRARPTPPSADEIDDLLDKTLSSLELPRQRRPAPPAAPPVAPAPSPALSPFAAPPAVPRPAAPAAPAFSAPAPPAAAAPPQYRPPVAPAPPSFVPAAAPFSIPAPAPIAPAPVAPAPPMAAAPAAVPLPTATPFSAATPAPAPAVTPAFPAFSPTFEALPPFESLPAFESLPSFESLPVFESMAAFEPAAAIPSPAPFEPFLSAPGTASGGTQSAADPWQSDPWPSSGSFAGVPELAGAAGGRSPESRPPESRPAASPSADPWAIPEAGAGSFSPRLEMPPQQPPPRWEPASADDTGWSVSSFDDLPTPKLSSRPDFPPADFSSGGFTPAGSSGSPPPADFLSAFAPPSETGSFVKPLPRPREDGQMVSTSDFGLAQEADPGLRATLDGVLQIRGDHPGGRHEGELEGAPFGDYRLMERVAIGGMAEVWRARRRGVEGFQKTVAIKKILSHLTGSVDFVTMFIDEAKLAAQLSHNNIIQIYDLGKVDDDFYIAMEYVEGWDLRTILAAGRERGLPLPMPLALAICAAVARALDYAHRKRDFANRALGLVHRDVSPQNVLISHEGEIKLCDFGIVKAVSKASTTQMGALKGKLQYMSPEQAWGREVDARSDIFSLGSVLFEVLTGTKLFTGDSEIGVLDAVRDCRIRSPREIVPRIPEEVERILLRSLAKNPEDRYQTAGQLEKDLIAVLDGLRLTPGQRDMADYLQQLFNTPLLRQEARSASFPQLSPAPATGSAAGSASAISTAPPAPTPAALAPAGDKSKAGLAAVAVLLLALALFLAWFFLLRQPAETAPSAVPAEPAREAPAEGAPDAAGAAAGTAPGPAEAAPAGGAAGSDVVRQLVNEQLDARQKEIERDFDEKRRKLEEELARVQRENNRGGGNKPASGDNKPPGGR